MYRGAKSKMATVDCQFVCRDCLASFSTAGECSECERDLFDEQWHNNEEQRMMAPNDPKWRCFGDSVHKRMAETSDMDEENDSGYKMRCGLFPLVIYIILSTAYLLYI